MSQRDNWIGILLITIVSGLVIKVVGDPVVELTTPAIADFFDEMDDRVEDTMDDIGDWFKGDRDKRNTLTEVLR
jgi:hypothetical protein